jgi:hypothetical protein
MSFQRIINSSVTNILAPVLFAMLLEACTTEANVPCANPGADSGSGTCADNTPDSVPYPEPATDNVQDPVPVPTPDHINHAPTTTPVTLNAAVEDSVRVITQAELLASASDVDGDALTVTDLGITSGEGTLVAKGGGAWNYSPALNEHTSVSFSYSVTDGALTVSGTASLDITPINDAPTTTDVTLTSIVADSGVRVITQAELLANASDVDGDALSAMGLVIRSGGGTLVANGIGTWSYTPAHNDETGVSFGYIVTDGDIPVAGSASLDITPSPDSNTLSWIAPVAREDESPISTAEIGGYRMYYGTAPNDYTQQIDINDGTTVKLALEDLPSGTYYFVITTIDLEGRESVFSNMVTKSI